MEWTADKIRKLQQIAYETDVTSLNEILERDEAEHHDTTEIADLLPVDQISMEEMFLKQDGNDRLMAFVKKLSPREQLIIRMRFGLDDGVPKTLTEVGKKFKVTRERTRQIEAKALIHLKKLMAKSHANYNTFR